MQMTRLKRLFTDTDMHDPEFRGAIEIAYRYLQINLPAEGAPSKNYDLVLDMLEEGGKTQWFYYCACHKTRCLFWLETYDAKDMIFEVYWVASPAHISASPVLSSIYGLCLLIRFSEHRLEALYWYFYQAGLDLNWMN